MNYRAVNQGSGRQLPKSSSRQCGEVEKRHASLLHVSPVVTDNRYLTVAMPPDPRGEGGTRETHTAAFEGYQLVSKAFFCWAGSHGLRLTFLNVALISTGRGRDWVRQCSLGRLGSCPGVLCSN